MRFRYKTWLFIFLSLIIGFVFSLLKLFGIYPEVTEDKVLNIVNQFLTFPGLIGVLVDPTAAGTGDSERALGYESAL